jgi:O-antigen/teichoic acid export membrane protein
VLRHSEVRQFFSNRYFLFGLALQKGTPILLLPLFVAVFGAAAYSDYVLFYAIVQVLALISSLGLAHAVIPFWYEQGDKGGYLGALAGLLLGLSVVVGVPLAILISLVVPGATAAGAWWSVVISVVFAVIYNLNTVGLNVIRVEQRQRVFFGVTLVSSLLMAATVVVLRLVPGAGLRSLIVVNAAILALQTVGYFLSCPAGRHIHFRQVDWKSFGRKLLTFSLPLTVYIAFALAAQVGDKWIVNARFPQPIFVQYVLDFQFAFTVSLVSVVVGMYNTQRVCQLIHEGEQRLLRSNTLGNYGLSAIGSIAAAVAAFAYASVTHIHLSRGFWALVAAFTVNNLYGVNSNLLTSQKRSRTLAVISGTATTLFMGVLLLAGAWRKAWIVYAAYPLYYVSMFAASTIAVSGTLRRRGPGAELDAHGDVALGRDTSQVGLHHHGD